MDRTVEMWDKMNDNEKFGCQFGLFPKWLDDQYHPTKDETVKLMGMGKPNINRPIEQPKKISIKFVDPWKTLEGLKRE